MADDESALRRNLWRKLKREVATIPFLEDVLTAHYCAFDRHTPVYVKAALVGAIVYFVVPDDLIPDSLPIIGLCRRCRRARHSDQADVLAYQAGTSRGGAAHGGAAARGVVFAWSRL